MSRSTRSFELRVSEAFLSSQQSRRLALEVVGKKIHLVPIRGDTPEARAKKREEIIRHYSVQGPFLFVHVHLRDNRSEFSAPLEFELAREGPDYVTNVYGAIAIANTIAYVSEMIDPISIFNGKPYPVKR